MRVEGHRIVVKPMPPDDDSEKMIIVPHTVKEREARAQMIGLFHKAGPLADLCFYKEDKEEYTSDDEMITAQDLKPGMKMLFVQYPGLTIPDDDGETYWWMQDSDILGIIE